MDHANICSGLWTDLCLQLWLRRGLAFYHLGLQREAWNDLTECLGGAPRHLRKQLGVSYALDIFRLTLNPQVLIPFRTIPQTYTRAIRTWHDMHGILML